MVKRGSDPGVGGRPRHPAGGPEIRMVQSHAITIQTMVDIFGRFYQNPRTDPQVPGLTLRSSSNFPKVLKSASRWRLCFPDFSQTQKLVKATETDKNRGDALLKVPELATRIGVSSDWVYDAVNFNGLPCCRLNAPAS